MGRWFNVFFSHYPSAIPHITLNSSKPLTEVMDMAKTKVCNGCKKKLSIDLFHKNKNEPYGVHSICKQCKEKYRQENRERLLKNDRKRWEQYKKQLEKYPLSKNATKICNCCKKELPINIFYKDLTKRDGLTTFCKSCKIKKGSSVSHPLWWW